ncbi:hypothetical protein BHE74_00016921 [Ensete ventricosum]|nr:hypothetical protein BHE74_00016921 [Ensete ventricosum]RZR86800.1 hypothetical protein BHM03_00014055 [Ensete ventricosum]
MGIPGAHRVVLAHGKRCCGVAGVHRRVCSVRELVAMPALLSGKVVGTDVTSARWSAEACSPDLSLGLGNTEKIHCFCCDFGGNRKKIEFYAGGVVVLGF